MVFQVIESLSDSCRVVGTFGSRELAERCIARAGKRKRPAAQQKRMSIEEIDINPETSPFFQACQRAGEHERLLKRK